MLNKRILPRFDPDIYTKIALNELVVYAISYFYKDGVEMTPEDIISACFLLFPKRFALRNYPQWPDAAIVSRCCSECRVKGYITGSTAKGFKLTAKGSNFAENVAKDLGSPIKPRLVDRIREFVRAVTSESVGVEEKQVIQQPEELVHVIEEVTKSPRARQGKTHIHPSVKKVEIQKEPLAKLDKVHSTPLKVSKEVKARATKFVKLMDKSDAYIHYRKNGKNSKIGEFDFRSMLLCTMESSRETLVKNINLFKGYAAIHKRQDLLVFLSHCEDRFSYLLAAPQKQLKKQVRKSRK